MEMTTLQFYKNKYRYPHYSATLTAYGSPMPCTPVGVNLKSGTLLVRGEMLDFMSCNYLSIERGGNTLYAWIDDVSFHTEDSFKVTYSVDAWRTYKNKISLGTQFIKRSPVGTILRDPLLGSINAYPSISTRQYTRSDSDKRIFVVQVRASSGEVASNTPVQPTPYQFYLCQYDITDWQAAAPIANLMNYLANNADSKNIVTMYSLPYMSLSGLPSNPLTVSTVGGGSMTITGFKCISGSIDIRDNLVLETPLNLASYFGDISELLKVDHSVQIVIPEAGIISIPDELLLSGSLALRQDIDLFSGSSNYMLVDSAGYYTHSTRGGSISSIPFVSDPKDTYLAQNHNSLTVGMLGNVASIVGGVALGATTGGVGAALGAGTVAGGFNGLMNTFANIGDSGQTFSNPPAFLGSALAPNFNQTFWVVVKHTIVDNADTVHANFGYPYNMVDTLTMPSSGYIKTEGCNVWSSDGTVPRWAMEEINNNFNNGILVH